MQFKNAMPLNTEVFDENLKFLNGKNHFPCLFAIDAFNHKKIEFKSYDFTKNSRFKINLAKDLVKYLKKLKTEKLMKPTTFVAHFVDFEPINRREMAEFFWVCYAFLGIKMKNLGQ